MRVADGSTASLKDFADLPAAADPAVVARRLAEHFLETSADAYKPRGYKYRSYGGKLDEYANLRDVCIGTGKKNDHQYYLDRPREAGDPHGRPR